MVLHDSILISFTCTLIIWLKSKPSSRMGYRQFELAVDVASPRGGAVYAPRPRPHHGYMLALSASMAL